MPKQAITILSNFNEPIRGVSSYSDKLFKALQNDNRITLDNCDYKAAYPLAESANDTITPAALHYLKPWTWFKLVKVTSNLLHIQYWTQFQAYYLYFIVKKRRCLNAKTIITIHNPLPHESLWPLSFFEYYLFKSCDHLIVHNIEGKEVLLRLLGESCPDITIIPHGIDNESEVSISHKLVPSSSYLLFAGNIRPYKGLDNLLDAWAIYDRESNENMQLIIAGKLWGDPKKGFNVFHKLLGMSRYARKILQKLEMANNVISYLNFIPEDEFNGLIQKADMIVLPYKHFHSESGIVSKALGFNISILVSRVVGLKRYASSEDYIIADTAALPFAKQLRYLIESSSNDTSDLVKSHVRNASWDRVADAHINVYEKVSNIGEYQ